MVSVVVAVGENCGLMYVQGAHAQCALATCSLTALKPFALSLEKVGSIPCRETSLQCLQRRALLGLETTVVV